MVTGLPSHAGRLKFVVVFAIALAIGLVVSPAHAQTVTRGPYLQLGDDDSIVVRWRTDEPTRTRVRYGSSPATLNSSEGFGGNRTEHEVELTGLLPGTRYFYAVGTNNEILAGGDADHFFNTAPAVGSSQPTRVWVLGDSGTANANVAAVRDAYLTFTGSQTTHLWLMLGDNAYQNGTDAEYQTALFDMFPSMLRRAVLWPTLGNHDVNSSDSDTESGPYFDMFTLPRMAEAGGVVSGTEAYYSFDYANIHFVVLDSADSLRTAGSPMLAWLQNDLAMATADWLVAYWHHPPYSKGSHDSDDNILDFQLIQMRENAVEILEQYGVDLVLAGHSHSYERSFLLDGHYDTSDTFGPEFVVDPGDGRPAGDGAYVKPLYGGRQGAVYTVAGSSGQTTGGTLDHPAMYISLNELGSVILEFAGLTVDVSFLNSTGTVSDSFTLVKNPDTVVEFSAVPTTGPAPLAVAFTDESLVGATAWAWDFENDGSIDSTDQHPDAIYASPGMYSVKLAITAPEGVFERVKTDFIVVGLDPPVAEFTSNLQIGAVPLTVNFTDLSAQLPAGWDWDFDNDTIIDSTDRDPSWTFNEAGTYTVSLTAHNLAGSSTETKTGYIVVTPTVPGEITNLLFDGSQSDLIWDPHPDACLYDLVKGDLTTLRAGGGQFETSQLACTAQETAVPAAQDTAIPAPGEGFFYVSRGVTCTLDAGTYDTSNPFQFKSRDLPLQGPSAACGCNPASDTDGDGFCDPFDVCPTIPNSNQADQDADGFGDACDCDPLSDRCTSDCTDIDADTFCLTSDCDDQSAETFPGAAPNDDPAACMADLDMDDWGEATPLPLVTAGTDCDDSQAGINPTTTWYADFDDDGFGDPGTSISQCDEPVGWLLDATDCDDSNADTFPGSAPADDPAACMKDADGDGWGDASPAPGITPGADCDDDSASAAAAFPGAAPNDDVSACMKDVDGDDWGDVTPPAGVTPGTDCDDVDADLTPVSVWYADTDGDGFGDLFVSLTQCIPPVGFVADSTDCDDVSANAALTFPGAAPNDDPLACMKDVDGDDWGDSAPLPGVLGGSDCADDDPASGPTSVWFADADGDSFGDVNVMLQQCEQPAGYVFDNTDCDDDSPTAAVAFPGAAPNDSASACLKDADGDGWGDSSPPAGVSTGSDCDDDSPTAASAFPGAAPNDGAGCLLDADGDDWGDATPPVGVSVGTDCDDTDPAINPTTNWYRDSDLDSYGDVAVVLTQCTQPQPAGFVLDSTDCDDTSPTAASTFRGAAPNDSALACMKDVDGDDFGDSSPPAGVTPGSDCNDGDDAINIHTQWYADTDGDGFGDPAAPFESCLEPAGHVSDGSDCDDSSPTAATTYPGAAPNDSGTTCMKDADGDGWGDSTPPVGVTLGSDCDDDLPGAAETFPGAAPNDSGSACMKDVDGDEWGDLIPPAGVTPGSDCDDADDSRTPLTTWYSDADGDGYGNLFITQVQCAAPVAYVRDSTDCDDVSPTAAVTFPGAAPNDDSFVCMKDADGDEWGDDSPLAGVVPGSDCADDDPLRGPTTAWFADADGDTFGDVSVMFVQCDQPLGFLFDNTDCDDTSATAASTFPGAAPSDGAGACMKDVDDDDWGDDSPPAGVSPGTDCDDDSPTGALTFPGAAPSDGAGCLLDADDDDWGDATPPPGVPPGTDCDDSDAELSPDTVWYRDADLDGFGDVAEELTQCLEPAGYVLDSTDCDDTSPTAAETFPGSAPNDSDVACMRDVDGDDWGDLTPIAGVIAGTDCDDTDISRNPTTTWYADTDTDGFGDVAVTLVQCAQPPAHVLNATDCDDTSATAASTFPGAASSDSASACMKDADNDGYGDDSPPAGVTGGTDCNDANQLISPASIWYADTDGDTFGDPGESLAQCAKPAGYILDHTDCDDTSATAASTFPGAAPNDGATACMKDVDGDDWGDSTPPAGVLPGGDCNDADANLNPATLWYADTDADGFGDPAVQDQQCPQPPGYLLDATDCDDTSGTAAFTFPGAASIESSTACMRDVDGDNYGDVTPPAGVTAGTDCADLDPVSNPGAPEVCDGNDNNCDSTVPLDEIDNDGDRYVECSSWSDSQGDQPTILAGDDCTDADANTFPTAPELCDGNDNNCDTTVPLDEIDNDGDNYVECSAWSDSQGDQPSISGGDDCDDADSASNPGAAELCDGNDNNCDTTVPADEIDNDGDLYVECSSWVDSQGDQPTIVSGDDCDDADSSSNPGAAEVCDGNDNDCTAGVPLTEIDNDGDNYVECSSWNDTQGDQPTILAGDDCADADANTYPTAPELCDGNDNNCDTTVPLDEIDNDGDNYVECSSWSDSQGDQPSISGGDDCDDADSASNPVAAELCDGNDNNCDTTVPADEIDNDGDLYVECSSWVDSQGDQPTILAGDDCDDADSISNPGAAEVCDGNDNDCTAGVPLTEIDNDGDNYVECSSWNDTQGDQPTILAGDDCTDADANSYPTAPELCDGNDNNCDTTVPLDEIDNDGDNYVECTAWNDTQSDQPSISGGDDCDDADSTSNPAAAELCDGNDNDCAAGVPATEVDNDGDLYVECSSWVDSQGDQPTIVGGDDCDDDDKDSNPGEIEICDGNDNDCVAGVPLTEIDNDGDNFVECSSWNDKQGDQPQIIDGEDCDDTDATSNPDASEVCDGNDNDCDTTVPAGEIDDDGDSYVECASWVDSQGDQPAILGGDDCDDVDSTSNPGAAELCDGNDNNCDTTVPADEIDNDGDLYVECSSWVDSQGDQPTIVAGDDCDDADSISNPGAAEVCDGNDNDCTAGVPLTEIDNDGDNYVECSSWNDTQGDQPTILAGDDCADADANTYPTAAELCDGNDNNCDTTVPLDEIDNDGDNYVECTAWNDTQSDQPSISGGDDCDDADSASNPGAAELCDGNDNNCDTMVPLDEIDNDGDNYVECSSWLDSQGDQPAIVSGDDCDDADSASNPGASEVCDGNDNDCTGGVPATEVDNDGDLYVECETWVDTQADQASILGGDDCADGDANSYPGAPELCDGNDNNCDSTIPADEIDNDGDNYVECSSWVDSQGDQPSILGGDDCDDADSASNPGASELCDGNDNNCDTTVPLTEIDNDGDLYVECSSWVDSQGDQPTILGGDDCDDDDAASNPGASELCDGNDNDCTAGVPATEVDNDGDLYVECSSWVDSQGDQPTIVGGDDCDDADSASNPGASEVCDGNDNDCAAGVPATEVDNDGDNYVECSSWVDSQGDQPSILGGDDCDDVDSASNPGASELCDGNDNNCDTTVPLDEIDNDGDNYVECSSWLDSQGDQPAIVSGDDCDDADSASNPGASEVCDGNDNDCDTTVPLDEIDNDGDNYVECTSWNDTQGDDSGIDGGGDCDDDDKDSNPGEIEICDGNDNDCVAGVPLTEIDNDGDNFVECSSWNDKQGDQPQIIDGEDCDDTDATSNPDASEVCDGNDNDCDTTVPAGEIDDDGDSYVECASWVDSQGDQPAILGGDDCDDVDSTSNPGAAELCDGNDNNCDTTVPADEIDNDGDLYVECSSWVDSQGDQPTIVAGDDCDDADSISNPGAAEVCDGNDNDCTAGVPLTEIDNDGDNYVECSSWNDTQGDQPTILAGDDCADADANTYPTAAELCDGNDNNCDTTVPLDEIDNDGDNYVECTAWNDTQSDQPSISGGDDCDDADSTSNPGAAELCDGNDNDCAAGVPATEVDNDGDLYVECNSWVDSQGDQPTIVGGDDCDDADSASNPGASEVCDGNDNDCTAGVPATEVDNDGDNYVECSSWVDSQGDQPSILGGDDCDDVDAASNPGASELCDGNDNNCDTTVPLTEIDNDGDLYVECSSWVDSQGDQPTILGGDDCDDDDAASNPGASELCDGNDNDCTAGVPATEVDNDGDLYVECSSWVDSQGDQPTIVGGDDCDDDDAASNPGASEVCDGNDNDCAAGVPATEVDNDGDLYVECSSWVDSQGDQPTILGGDDCDDADSASNPGASELCDGNDNNCDTTVPAGEADDDGDLYVECSSWVDSQGDQPTILGGDDCDDADSASNPGASELCDGNDNNCDTTVPLDEIDNDGDLYVECSSWADSQGDQPTILGGDDCADSDSSSYPGASELCDGNDNNCDTAVPAGEADDDGDLYVECSSWIDSQGDQPTILGGDDCADSDSNSYPGASELCDGNDNNCDTTVPASEADDDGDLYVECSSWVDSQGDQPTILGGDDCDDADSTSNPGASEVCDGNDNDCVGGVPADEADSDGDLYVACTPWSDTQLDQPTILGGGDCDDADSTSRPGAAEVCDGNDNNCDTTVPLTEIDNDGDLYVECSSWNDTQSDQPTILGGDDCDDTDSASNPGASEVCDGNDNDCVAGVPATEVDNDGDLYVECSTWVDSQGDQPTIIAGDDCDDADSASNPGATEVCDGNDNDCTAGVPATEVDNDGDLYVECSSWNDTQNDQPTILGGDDCDDTDSASNPGASEVCDGNDNDCTAGVPLTEVDNDGDLYVECSSWSDTQNDQPTILGGDDCDDTGGTAASIFPGAAPSDSASACMEDGDGDGWGDSSPPAGVSVGTDCADGSAATFPGAAATDSTTLCMEDVDGDDYGDLTPPAGVTAGTDCNDADAGINPATIWYSDTDADTYGDPGVTATQCTQPTNYVLDNTDCDDTGATAASIFPGAAPNDGVACMEDVDGDDYGDLTPPGGVTAGTDCNDADVGINPATIWYADTDADTYGDAGVTLAQCTQPTNYVSDSTDCDDTGTTAASIFPGAAPNDGAACMEDVDGDDWGDDTPPSGVTAGTDCDDSNAAVFPGAGC